MRAAGGCSILPISTSAFAEPKALASGVSPTAQLLHERGGEDARRGIAQHHRRLPGGDGKLRPRSRGAQPGSRCSRLASSRVAILISRTNADNVLHVSKEGGGG